MIFKMDTDAVRAMAARFRSAADAIEMGSTATNQNVQGAPWQSQAREEFVLQMDMLNNSIRQSAEILRLMGTAAEQKAGQWEAVGNMFNGPFPAISSVWNRLKSMMGGLWSRIKGAISGIKWPSLPKYLFPGFITPITLLPILKPMPWFNDKPSWWPFPPKPGDVPLDTGVKLPFERIPGKERPSPLPDKLPDRTVPSKVIPRPYPQPPNSPTLRKVTGDPSSYTCATYARDRRPDLGSTGPATDDYPLGAAANYRHKFSDTAFQINQSDGSLTDAIGPGYAIVWEPDHAYADNTYGHVAIVEAVYPDHIVISEAVRDANGVYYIREKTVSFEDINNDSVWLIP
jgi:uncharacterized protein YukE